MRLAGCGAVGLGICLAQGVYRPSAPQLQVRNAARSSEHVPIVDTSARSTAAEYLGQTFCSVDLQSVCLREKGWERTQGPPPARVNSFLPMTVNKK